MAYKNSEDQNRNSSNHYKKNKPAYIERNRRARKEKRQYLQSVKNVPCADCGERYPYYVMDFDHRPGETKLHHPNKLSVNAGWKSIEAEVAKCDVVCANCHRLRTFSHLNSPNPNDTESPRS